MGLELLRGQAISLGDLGAVVRLEEWKSRDGKDLETLVRQQAEMIEALRKELDAMRMSLKNP